MQRMEDFQKALEASGVHVAADKTLESRMAQLEEFRSTILDGDDGDDAIDRIDQRLIQVEEWRQQVNETEDLDSKIQRIIQQELRPEQPMPPPPLFSNQHSTQTDRTKAPSSAQNGGHSEAAGTVYLGFEKANGKRTWCEFSNQGERDRLTRNGWNMEWSTNILQEILHWVKGTAPTDMGGVTDDGAGYLGFEKANGKRTWCEFSNQTERARLTKNGWNMEWSTSDLQAILKWVNEASRARACVGKDAEPEAVPSHINLTADTSSRASSDPPGSRADHLDGADTTKHDNTTGGPFAGGHSNRIQRDQQQQSSGSTQKGSPVQQEATAKLQRRNPYLYNSDGTPKKPPAPRPPQTFGKLPEVIRKEAKIRRHYSQEYKIPEYMIHFDGMGLAFIWQNGCKLYMYNRLTTPPAREIFDDEDDFGNIVDTLPTRIVHTEDAKFNQEVGTRAADEFAQGLIERLEDENARQTSTHKQYPQTARNLRTELDHASGDHSLRTQPPSDEDFDDEDGERRGTAHLQLLLRLKSSNADAETTYLMGDSGVPQLSKELLTALDFPHPDQTLRDIDEEHQTLMEGWSRPASRGFAPVVGPDQKQLLKDLPVFTRLKSTKLTDVIDFISQFHGLLGAYTLCVMPFDQVVIEFGHVGLCYPGVGTKRYRKMGLALAKLLYDRLIPRGLDKSGSLDEIMRLENEQASPNGYVMLWRLLEECVSAFNPDAIQITWPTYQEDMTIFEFTRCFVLTERLCAQKGAEVLPRGAALAYLDEVNRATGNQYQAAVMLFKSKVMDLPRKGRLPKGLTINDMASFIAKSNKTPADPTLQIPLIHKTEASDPSSLTTSTQPSTATTSHPLQTPSPDIPIPRHLLQQRPSGPSAPWLTTPEPMQGFSSSRYEVNQVFRNGSKKRSVPSPKRGEANPQRLKTFDPTILCGACNKQGHPACRCYALGLAVLLRKYMDTDNFEVMQAAEKEWVERNKKYIKETDAPLKVLRVYMDRYNYDIDMVDEMLDWAHLNEDYEYEGAAPLAEGERQYI